MTDQSKPTTVSVKMLSTRAEFREAYLRALDENETLKAQQEQDALVLRAIVEERDALKAEVERLRGDYTRVVAVCIHWEHEARKADKSAEKSEAELAAARPLLDAAGKVDKADELRFFDGTLSRDEKLYGEVGYTGTRRYKERAPVRALLAALPDAPKDEK